MEETILEKMEKLEAQQKAKQEKEFIEMWKGYNIEDALLTFAKLAFFDMKYARLGGDREKHHALLVGYIELLESLLEKDINGVRSISQDPTKMSEIWSKFTKKGLTLEKIKKLKELF